MKALGIDLGDARTGVAVSEGYLSRGVLLIEETGLKKTARRVADLAKEENADVLVIESLSLGMDRYKEKILSILSKVLAEDGIKIRGIYERSDAKEREKEGMQRTKGFLSEPFDTKVRITENGVAYEVDVENGQKTGFFLDQKFNRLAVQRFAKDKDVLDCFTHTGSFALVEPA